MVRVLKYFRLLNTVTKCTDKNRFIPNIMPKRSTQSPPGKKLKADQEQTNVLKNISALEKDNLKPEIMTVDKMENDNQEAGQNTEYTSKHGNSRIKVEYLETPIKSENDKKEYRVIKLENGLTALLIANLHTPGSSCLDDEDKDDDNENKDALSSESEDEEDEDDEDSEDMEDEEDEEDEEANENGEVDSDNLESFAKRTKREEKMAACGLCIGVGSFSDPPEIPGMAHFLEHMVFMGSEKYPQENDFDAFTKKHGGSNNASTECEQTTFYFEVQEKHLLPALDRFAQFFINPLMKRDTIARERESVESEFQMALPSDVYRKEQLFCSFAKAGHPATKFTWGNLITLRDNITDDKLYEELHKFRERHYSAHRMKLAIQARLPLDTLEEYVIQCFANVPNNGLPPDDFSIHKGADSFDTEDFRKIYKIKPIKDFYQVELTWAMSSLHDLYRSKPHQYVSWIIGHAGKGSLISYLRKKMWCLDIFSGNGEGGFEHSSMYALFSVILILTDEGHRNLKEVLDAIFSFINLLRKEGIQKRIYDEIHQIEETNFRFSEATPAADYVEDLCENMHFYPPKDYITGSELYFEYNPEAIKACIDYLTPENVNIIISNKKYNDEEFDKEEPWFKTKYRTEDIPSEWIENWKTIPPLPEFHLPLSNEFLTDDFNLINVSSDIPKYPSKIYSDSITEIWYQQDAKFRLPECYMCFYLITPLVITSAQNAALMDLFVAILKQLLLEPLYPATVAELQHYIYPSAKGIVMRLNGFSQKLPLVLETIVQHIADYSNLVTRDLFEVMKEEQSKAYYNTFLKPGKLAKDVRLSLIMQVHWSTTDKHAAIADIGFEEFQNFLKCFTDHLYIQCLVQGNMTADDAIKYTRESIVTLKCGELLPDTMPQLKVVKLPMGTHNCKVRNFNKTDTNSVVTNYYQSGLGSIEVSVIIELLIMMMEEPLFNQLRTQEQLGYDVSCVLRDTYGIFGYSVTVCTQANKYTTEHVDKRIEEFLKSFNKILQETTEEDLNSIKKALIKQKQCDDVHLKEEVYRNWAEITMGEYVFDRLEKEMIAIEGIELEQLRNWMACHTLNGNNFRKLSIQVVGTTANDVDDIDKTTCFNKSITAEKLCNDASVVECQKTKYSLEYVPYVSPDANTADNSITDIQDFKRNLEIYPVNSDLLRR